MRQPKMGGKEKLRVFIKGNNDIADSLLAIQKGGSKLDRGLTNMVGDRYNFRGTTTASLRSSLQSSNLVTKRSQP